MLFDGYLMGGAHRAIHDPLGGTVETSSLRTTTRLEQSVKLQSLSSNRRKMSHVASTSLAVM